MIYIFEDRAKRRTMHQELVDAYKDKICFAKFDIDEGMNLEDYIIENFIDAEVIIFHKSYSFKSKNVNLEEIIKKMPGVRFVIFSGGNEHGGISEDGNIVTINADVMYGNLETFLKSYTNENDINLDILLWGEKYNLNKMLSLQSMLFDNFFINANLQEQADIEEILDHIPILFEVYNDTIQGRLISAIEPYKETGITWGNLLQIFQDLISKQNA